MRSLSLSFLGLWTLGCGLGGGIDIPSVSEDGGLGFGSGSSSSGPPGDGDGSVGSGSGGEENLGGGPVAGGSQNGGSSGGSETGGSISSNVGGSDTAVGGVGGTVAGAGGSEGLVIDDVDAVHLSDLCMFGESENGWGPIERDLSNGEEAAGDGGPITLGAKVYSKGLGMHAPARVAYDLGGQCTRLTADLGLDIEMRGAGSVIFEVWGDGKPLFQSELLTGQDRALPMDVDITGVSQLELVVDEDEGNGSDHADWADAKISCADAELLSCAGEALEAEIPAGFQLAWSDEFDVEGRPNSENWGFEEGFARNEELQWYQADNAWVQSGFLIIEGRREQIKNPNFQSGSDDWKRNREYSEFTSSSLRTMGKQHFKYGRFEMRARVVAKVGLWPAFWTLGESGEWPSNGEIDIFEYYGGNLHANAAAGTNTRWEAKWDGATAAVSSLGADWDSKFHVWRMDWDEQALHLFVDDQELNSITLDDLLNSDGKSPFRQPHYILVNLAIGGQSGGDPSGTTFPSHYEIDYVRVYQEL